MRSSAVVAAVVAGAALLPVSAHASSSPSEGGGGWVRYHQPDVTVAAGTGCAFEVFEHVVRDKEYYRDVSTYPDGKPALQQWKGPLVMQFTNVETGVSVVRDLSGRAVMQYRPDGSLISLRIETGHFSARMPPGSTPVAGIIRVGGKDSTLYLDSNGQRTIVPGPRGTLENICEALD